MRHESIHVKCHRIAKKVVDFDLAEITLIERGAVWGTRGNECSASYSFGVLDTVVSNAGSRPPMIGNFSCGRSRFVLQADTPLRLNAFAGSTLRGGFGHVFKRIVCTWHVGDCPRCLLKTTCSYPYIFETAPPPVGHFTTFEVTSPWSVTAPTRLCAVIGRPGSA